MSSVTFQQDTQNETPVVFVLSDSRGITATHVVEAAADQFEEGAVIIKRLCEVTGVAMVLDFLNQHIKDTEHMAVFHTIANEHLRREIRLELDKREIPSIDLLGPAINVLGNLTQLEPVCVAGRRAHVEIEEVK